MSWFKRTVSQCAKNKPISSVEKEKITIINNIIINDPITKRSNVLKKIYDFIKSAMMFLTIAQISIF